ncbi:MAG TPA: DsbA family oxidoreductase [Polyangiaceae bacterium]|jgi:predicted DsbA family dithiol-disulfide isomerase|nr:DsbA family oxidoreductase [Polyangiaceae bacterium]
MNIEIFSDVACPWCFIGKRRLGRALAGAGVRAQLVFRAFQLQPGLPVGGVPAQSFFERKFGSEQRVRAVFERVTEIGRDEGIAFDFSKQPRAPNTELCHRVIHIASQEQRGDAAVEALFRGYFEQGVNLCEVAEVISLLEREGVGLDSAELGDRLAAGEGKDEVARDRRKASEYGVGGVPLFIFGQRYAIEGAQPLEHFQRMIGKVRAESGSRWRGASPP